MKQLIKRSAVAFATGSLIFGMFIPASIAQISLEISGNGAGSNNNVGVDTSTTTVVTQTNTANIQNNVNVTTNSGGNTANKNTGGSVTVATGDASASVNVTNNANSNAASVDNCGSCLGGIEAKISGNGADSTNKILVGSESETHVTQANDANVENNVTVNAKTGNNTANKNTGGDVTIDTGNATVDDVSVSTSVNANQAMIGGGSGDTGLSLWITGNGADSNNTIGLDVDNSIVVAQANEADIENNISVTANTGNNTAKKNTGGGVAIETGDADVAVDVDNTANFNVADVNDCCLLSGTAKIAGNGTDSINKLLLALNTATFATQLNNLDCDGRDGACADITVESKSGDNVASKNTGDPGDDPSIDTGDTGASIDVGNSANSNGLSIGGDVVTESDVEFPAGFPFGFDNFLGFWAWFMMGA